MTASRTPALEASDGPSFGPDSDLFRVSAAAVSCAFPLNSTAGEAATAGLDGALTMSNSDQTGTYTVQSGLLSAEVYGAFPTGSLSGTGQKLDASTGIVAVALNPDSFSNVEPAGDGGVKTVLGFYTTGLAVHKEVVYSLDDTGYRLDVGNSGDIKYTNGSQVTVWFNANTSQWGVGYVNTSGTPTSYTKGAYTPQQLVIIMSMTEDASIGGGFAGTDIVASFVTAASSITSPVPAGAKDPCGNDI